MPITHSAPTPREAALLGVILGTAVGDSLGLPAEGLRPATIRRRWQGEWKHRLVFGRGLISDDTEHTLFVAQCLHAHPADPDAFQRALAWKLRGWLLALPAGVGLATGRAIFKLWLGWPPTHSGVFSAGNGPAMRSAVIGVYFADQPSLLRAYVRASTRLTHTDPQAETAALAIAETAAWIVRASPADPLWARLAALDPDPRWQGLMTKLQTAAEARLPVAAFATSLGLQNGVGGYALHTVPVALYAWWAHRRDFRAALVAALDCGGDTDTVGAIVGALAGVESGPAGIPDEWLQGIAEWPRSVAWMRTLAATIANSQTPALPRLTPPVWFGPATLLRNLVFLGIVLFHGFARLLPLGRKPLSRRNSARDPQSLG